MFKVLLISAVKEKAYYKKSGKNSRRIKERCSHKQTEKSLKEFLYVAKFVKETEAIFEKFWKMNTWNDRKRD